MWLKVEQVTDAAVSAYREALLCAHPNYVVIDNLFDDVKLDEVMQVLQQPHDWQAQKHTYSALYVDSTQWESATKAQQFVSRDIWKREAPSANSIGSDMAQDFLSFLRGDEFMQVLSGIFDVPLTDMNVAKPGINTNFFRLNTSDLVGQHADDSPGREVCLLLYLNREWRQDAGGELVFKGRDGEPIRIVPSYNRCVLFDPSSKGSEHWVGKLNPEYANEYRYNVTSWYWSE
ncbi:MAG: SM-20-related protein [Candidatus Azotimanducaceae bacterium]|jgi:SM-20-related protein